MADLLLPSFFWTQRLLRSAPFPSQPLPDIFNEYEYEYECNECKEPLLTFVIQLDSLVTFLFLPGIPSPPKWFSFSLPPSRLPLCVVQFWVLIRAWCHVSTRTELEECHPVSPCASSARAAHSWPHRSFCCLCSFAFYRIYLECMWVAFADYHLSLSSMCLRFLHFVCLWLDSSFLLIGD